MRYLIVYAHPSPKSFNHAVKEAVEAKLKKEGKRYDVRDLYALRFNPVLSGADFTAFKQGAVPEDIRKEQEFIRNADTMIFIHPVWWFGMPAILKGYVDRVYSYGFAYKVENGALKGMLTGKKVIILNTTGGTEEDYRNRGFKDAMDKTIDIGTFKLCGLEIALHKFFHAVTAVSKEVRAAMLEEIDKIPL